VDRFLELNLYITGLYTVSFVKDKLEG